MSARGRRAAGVSGAGLEVEDHSWVMSVLICYMANPPKVASVKRSLVLIVACGRGGLGV